MYHGYIKLTCIMVMLNDSDCCPDMSLYCLSLNSIGYRRHDKVSVVTELIKTIITCVTLAGSGGVIR